MLFLDNYGINMTILPVQNILIAYGYDFMKRAFIHVVHFSRTASEAYGRHSDEKDYRVKKHQLLNINKADRRFT
jgi:hypothetical protein